MGFSNSSSGKLSELPKTRGSNFHCCLQSPHGQERRGVLKNPLNFYIKIIHSVFFFWWPLIHIAYI